MFAKCVQRPVDDAAVRNDEDDSEPARMAQEELGKVRAQQDAESDERDFQAAEVEQRVRFCGAEQRRQYVLHTNDLLILHLVNYTICATGELCCKLLRELTTGKQRCNI